MATTYAVINLSDTNAIANTQGLLSYQVEPSFITNGSLVPVETLNHEEALALLATPEWTPVTPPEEE
jgi:hypothetical protein